MNRHGCGKAPAWSSAEVRVPCSTWNQYSLGTQLCSTCGVPVIGVVHLDILEESELPKRRLFLSVSGQEGLGFGMVCLIFLYMEPWGHSGKLSLVEQVCDLIR